MTPQIQEAFDKKYEEIGEDIWHDLGNDRIFYYGWKACEAVSERTLEQQLDCALEFCRQYQIESKALSIEVAQLKESTAWCYEKNLDLNIENFELKTKNEHLVIENNHLQFLLDSVMLEYCPEEMTEEQMENWSKHQKKSNLEIKL